MTLDPKRFHEYFLSRAAKEPRDPHWRNGVAMCDRWLALMARSDVSQTEIDAFIQRLDTEPDCGTGWVEMGLRFRAWARKKGFKIT